MSAITVRNIPESIHDKLRIRAAKARRSVEAEIRHIIAVAIERTQQPFCAKQLQQSVRELFGDERPTNTVDELIAERRAEARHEEDLS